MRRAAVSPGHLPLAPAVLVALALHAGVLLLLRSMPAPAVHPHAQPVPAEVELALLEEAPMAASAPGAVEGSPQVDGAVRLATALRAAAPAPASTAAAHSPSDAEVDEELHAGGAAGSGANPGEPSNGTAAPRGIDLGLNGGIRQAALLGGWLELPPTPGRPTDGGLRQGLAALDAERGLARSSAAHHAAYEAARRFAPKLGIGIFDVTTDERGLVVSVSLASAPSSEADWQRVGEALHQLLRERRLRVPAGARGLAARLRIETGELAQDNAERFRTERAPALGEAPLHAREMRYESTRKSQEPGQVIPTLGMSVAGGGAGRIRVVLLDERAL